MSQSTISEESRQTEKDVSTSVANKSDRKWKKRSKRPLLVKFSRDFVPRRHGDAVRLDVAL